MNKFLIFLGLVLVLSVQGVLAQPSIRELFKNNEAVIYALSIRNFGALDADKDGIIIPANGDIRGTFLNAKEKLKDLATEGVNVIYVFPITKTGKLKALGTAGSLYAMDSFDTIDPKLDEEDNDINVYKEAQEFIKEAHKYNMNVVLDLPSCGSYDLSLNKPSWFILDENNESIIPADWTDVRLFKIYDEDGSLNQSVLYNFKTFVDMAVTLDFDGIRADVAAIKPYEFWKEIITYARSKKPDFLFLAEASPDWQNPAPRGVPDYTLVPELLKAGFDSYYGSFSDYKNIKTKKDFDEKLSDNIKILTQNKNKSMISALATHDQKAPILRGENYWQQVLWLSVTLPLNSYFLDGFSVGDDFTYDYENQKAMYSYTDDEYYYVHSGFFDIFNYTAPIRPLHPEFKKEYLKAIGFKKSNLDLFKVQNFKLLKTENEKVFSYSLENDKKELIVIGSLDEENKQSAKVTSSYLKKEHLFSIIKAKSYLKINKNKLEVTLDPLEVQVYLVTKGKVSKNKN